MTEKEYNLPNKGGSRLPWRIGTISTEHLPKSYQKNRLKLLVFRRWTNSKGSGEAESVEQTSLFHFNELMQYFYVQQIFLIHIFWETEDCSYSRSDVSFLSKTWVTL